MPDMSCTGQPEHRFNYEPLKSKSHIRLLRIKTLCKEGNYFPDEVVNANATPESLTTTGKDEYDDKTSFGFELTPKIEMIDERELSAESSKKRKMMDDKAVPQKRFRLYPDCLPIPGYKSDGRSMKQISLANLAFDIVQVSLEQTDIAYDTVSYVWGSPIRDCYLTLNDHQVSITSSLARAIPQLVRACETGFLWIDQLSINQDDIEERNQQVGIMGAIYKQGHHCLVPFSLDETFGTGKTNFLIEEEAEIRKLSLEDFEKIDEEVCYHMVNWIYRHDWFQRVWIFQEVVLARNPLLLIERWKLPFDILKELNRLIKARIGRENAKNILHGYTFVDVVSRLREHHLLNQPAKVVTIDTLLNELANSKASDPRDHIYAFLAVAIRQYDHFDISVDYSLSVQRTFAMATRAIIPLEGLSFFAFLPTRSHLGVNEHLPSWCPNWQIRVTAVAFPPNEPQATHVAWLRDHAVVYPSSKWYELILSGAIVDTIKDVLRGENMKDLNVEIGRAQGVKLNARTMQNDRSRQHERYKPDNPTQQRLRKTIDGVRTIRKYNNGKGEKEDAVRVLSTWRFTSCAGGGFSFAPDIVKAGDKVALLHGARKPVILRPRGKAARGNNIQECSYTVLGECYYEGVLQADQGEVSGLKFGKLKLV